MPQTIILMRDNIIIIIVILLSISVGTPISCDVYTEKKVIILLLRKYRKHLYARLGHDSV